MNSTNSSPTTVSFSPQTWMAITMRPVGIISSALSMCSLFRKLKAERNTFFFLMMLIAIFDLIFNLSFMVNRFVKTQTF
jgi:hypothetical protein